MLKPTPINIKLGDGEMFSSELYMKSLYLYIRLHLNSDFDEFKYIDDHTLITKVNGKGELFYFEQQPYCSKYFRWNKDTFIDNPDYIIQLGTDYIRIFDAVVVRSTLLPLLQSGGISNNDDGSRFGCSMAYVRDVVYNILITKTKQDE